MEKERGEWRSVCVNSSYPALEGPGNPDDVLRHLDVGVAGPEEPERGLAGEVGGHHHVRLAPGDHVVLAGPNHQAVPHHGYQAVNVSAELYLDQVTLSQAGVGVGQEGGVVAHDVVHRDTGREGNTSRVTTISTVIQWQGQSQTFAHFLVLLVSFTCLLKEFLVSEEAEISDRGARGTLSLQFPHHLVSNLRCHLVLRHHQVGGDGHPVVSS